MCVCAHALFFFYIYLVVFDIRSMLSSQCNAVPKSSLSFPRSRLFPTNTCTTHDDDDDDTTITNTNTNSNSNNRYDGKFLQKSGRFARRFSVVKTSGIEHFHLHIDHLLMNEQFEESLGELVQFLALLLHLQDVVLDQRAERGVAQDRLQRHIYIAGRIHSHCICTAGPRRSADTRCSPQRAACSAPRPACPGGSAR